MAFLDRMSLFMTVKLVILQGVVTLKIMYPPFYRCFFHNVSLWGKAVLGRRASGDVVFIKISHDGALSVWGLRYRQKEKKCLLKYANIF